MSIPDFLYWQWMLLGTQFVATLFAMYFAHRYYKKSKP